MFRYQSEHHPEFNGLRIEVQVRTRDQHAWATAVETVSLFTNQNLKGSVGDPDWLRLFALMGSEVARREDTLTIPGTPIDEREARNELRELAIKLDAIKKLEAY